MAGVIFGLSVWLGVNLCFAVWRVWIARTRPHRAHMFDATGG